MRKILSAVLSALIVSATVTSLPLSAGAASVEQGAQSVGAAVSSDSSVSESVCEPYFDIVDNSYAVVYGCSSYGNTLTIPSTYDGYPVREIKKDAFFWKKNLVKVVVPSSVTKIGYGAFYENTNLTTVSLSQGLIEIGDKAFHSCLGLKNISIPSTVKTIGEDAFDLCESIESITVPSNVTSLPKDVFYRCKSLKTVNLPSRLTSIGEYAFNGCESLTSISVPEGVTAIENNTFDDCKSLKTVSLPSTLKSIGDYAFCCCETLESITIPSKVTSIGEIAFRFCYALKNITLPSSLKTIKRMAFSELTSLESITIPKGVTTIPDYCFGGCSILNTVNLPSTLKRIEEDAFAFCGSLRTINFTGKLEYIGCGALGRTPWVDNHEKGKVFYHGVYALGYNPADNNDESEFNIAVKDGTTTFEMYCFFDYRIKSIVIPASVTEIRPNSFNWDASYLPAKLTDVYYMGTKAQWDKINIAWEYQGSAVNDALKNATIHYNYGKSVSTPKLTSASNVNGGVKVSWNAVDGATKYKVFRKTADTDWKALKTVTTTTYTDKTAVSGTTYYYTVRCVSPIDNSVYISSYNTTGLKKTYYAAPVLKAASNVNGGVKVTWNAVDSASRYKVIRRNADSTSWKALGYTDSTSYTDKTAESGKTYYYSVRCVNPKDNSSLSGIVEPGLKKTYYAAPTLKKASNVNGGVKVTWEAVAGASKYKVIRKTADSAYKAIGYSTSTSYTDKTAVSGETYYYSVKCVNPNDNVNISDCKPGLKKTYIAAPVLSKIVNTSKGVQLTWAASDGAVNYKVYRKNSAGSWEGIGTTTDTTFYDREAESGKTYTYTVKCVNENATSAVSGFDNTGKTIKFIAAPVISSLTKTGNGITIKWNAPAGTSNHYKVFWKNENGNWQSIATTTTTSFTDYDVQSGTKYTYTIRVVSADENSNLSGYTSGKSITF